MRRKAGDQNRKRDGDRNARRVRVGTTSARRDGYPMDIGGNEGCTYGQAGATGVLVFAAPGGVESPPCLCAGCLCCFDLC